MLRLVCHLVCWISFFAAVDNHRRCNLHVVACCGCSSVPCLTQDLRSRSNSSGRSSLVEVKVEIKVNVELGVELVLLRQHALQELP